jgi:putative flippase GtrA
LEKMINRMRGFVDIELLKFVIVGVLNTVVGMAIMFGLYNLAGYTYWMSSGTNYVLTSILSFFLNKYFTFQNKENSIRQVLRFALNIVICYILAYGIAKPAVLWLLSGAGTNIQENVAMLVGMCLFTGFNYIGQRFFAFKEKTRKE